MEDEEVIAMYVLRNENDCIFIGYPPEERRVADAKYKIKVFLIWILIALPITVLGFVFGSIGHGILFFSVLGFGGLYLCINMIKRVEIAYFSVLIDRDGVHEIWDYPKNKTEKHLRWDEIRYFHRYPRVVGGSSLGWWDVILFSSDEEKESVRKKRIRKVWRSSMQYEMKYREIPNNIFIVADPSQGELLNRMISDFAKRMEIKTTFNFDDEKQ